MKLALRTRWFYLRAKTRATRIPDPSLAAVALRMMKHLERLELNA